MIIAKQTDCEKNIMLTGLYFCWYNQHVILCHFEHTSKLTKWLPAFSWNFSASQTALSSFYWLQIGPHKRRRGKLGNITAAKGRPMNTRNNLSFTGATDRQQTFLKLPHISDVGKPSQFMLNKGNTFISETSYYHSDMRVLSLLSSKSQPKCNSSYYALVQIYLNQLHTFYTYNT